MDFLSKEKERVRAACFESWLDRGSISDGLEAALRDAVNFFNQGRDAKGGFDKEAIISVHKQILEGTREITFHDLLDMGAEPPRRGIELCLDAIRDMPASAATPSGVSLDDARRYTRFLASDLGPTVENS